MYYNLGMLTLRLPAETEKRLAFLAKKTGRTKSHYVREALGEYLEDVEDAYLGEAALEEFRKSGAEALSLDEVSRELELGD
jgi:RHH-type transcriptional regulator, rel operon repressor / antitoxin RelB